MAQEMYGEESSDSVNAFTGEPQAEAVPASAPPQPAYSWGVLSPRVEHTTGQEQAPELVQAFPAGSPSELGRAQFGNHRRRVPLADAVAVGIAQTFSFAGGATRSEYLGWLAFLAVAYPSLAFLGFLVALSSSSVSASSGALVVACVFSLLLLLLTLPTLALTGRALRSADRSPGWAVGQAFLALTWSALLAYLFYALFHSFTYTDPGQAQLSHASMTAAVLLLLTLGYQGVLIALIHRPSSPSSAYETSLRTYA